MRQLRAEVISIGDEITSGVRLDTNSQWLSSQLGELGIEVAFHSTVGDELQDNIDAFRIASERADVIVSTGGLGPTADDLTRQAMAAMAGVELFQDESVVDHIRGMYESRGREMPLSNISQAMFPVGSEIVKNPEGTAPGVDFRGARKSGESYRIFALPGVPVEMKQMWQQSVEPELRAQVGERFVIHHHTIHCFGTGESTLEAMLPDLIRRGRDPQVGITASAASISLRVTTRGESEAHCLEKMQTTIDVIYQQLGDLVYGENGVEMHQVVFELLKSQRKTLAITDVGLDGEVANWVAQADLERAVLVTGKVVPLDELELAASASEVAQANHADLGIAIGPIIRDAEIVNRGESFYEVVIANGDRIDRKQIRFGGHSAWREVRAVKEVLNFLRLHLLGNAK